MLQKLLKREMSEFYLEMEWCWNRLDGSFEQLRDHTSEETKENQKSKNPLEEDEEEEEMCEDDQNE